MISKATPNNDYSAKDIYVLEGLEPVRKRPGMYIGSTSLEGLHHLIWEVVDNSLDEALNGFASNIEIKLLENNQVMVKDDGRGIPVDIHPQTKKSALETVLCTLHAGGKFGGKSYKISGGLHGVGVSVVNALSKWLKAEVKKDGYVWTQEYSKGKAITPLKRGEKTTETGTTIIFEPDPEIFPEIKFEWKKIIDHLREQAYLVPKTFIKIKDEREKKNNVYNFYFEGGILAYLKNLIEDKELISQNIFYTQKDIDTMKIEIALCYISDIEALEVSFVNNIKTGEGGMHLTGFRSGLTKVLNDYAKENNLLKSNGDLQTFTGDDVREGLVAVISLKHPSPEFEGQTKAKLGNPEARTAVESVMSTAFKEFLEKNPNDAREIISKITLAAKARLAAKAAKESVLRKGILEGSSLPGKLADCQTKNMEEAELFIVEGDSAVGSAKQGRDRRFQAILPLRGKPLNIEKARLDKALANEEIKSLIIALGTAISSEFNPDKLRYNKIIIMTDADVDGLHIRTLLLTLFFRYFEELIERGHLYIAQPPLYKIQKGKIIKYAYSDEERDLIIKELQKLKTEKSKTTDESEPEITQESENVKESEEENIDNIDTEKIKGITIQRYKGLGEMNPEQLWETTMNPQGRILKQVTIEDAIEADKTFDILMGDEVLPRKKFIQTNAIFAKELDV